MEKLKPKLQYKKIFILAGLTSIVVLAAGFLLYQQVNPPDQFVTPAPLPPTFEVITPQEWQEGNNLPEGIMTPEEAIVLAHQVEGYEDEEIISVEAVYGENGEIWYWGVRTKKGMVTVKAQKK